MYTIVKKLVKNQELNIIEVKQENIEITFMDYGAAILSILVPDKNGLFETVLMGYEDLESYIENPIYLNAIIGPTSGRIKDATFNINGKEYVLDKNHLNMANLHGGSETFAYKVFDYHIVDNLDSTKVIFTLYKKQEESKYPGNQKIEIIYTIEDGKLYIEFNADTDEDTLLNLTNHAYFNLSGNDANSENKIKILPYIKKTFMPKSTKFYSDLITILLLIMPILKFKENIFFINIYLFFLFFTVSALQNIMIHLMMLFHKHSL